MNDSPLGAAVIGLRMGASHARGYQANPDTKLVAICDTNPELLAREKEEYGVDIAVRDYRELLESPDIHVISVVSPDYYHAEQSIAALEAGKDVLCDKPLTLDIEEAKAIVDAVEQTGRKFMIGQVCRYAPGFALAKKMIERGEIGELYFVESEYAHSYRGARGANDWRVDPRREPVIGGGCHAVDLLRWVAGNIEEVSAYANHRCLSDWPVNDCTVATLRFRNGVIGKVMVSIGCIRPYTMRSVFYGTEGTIVCDNTSPDIRVCSNRNLQGRLEFATFPVNVANHNVGAEINEFVDCIRKNRKVETDVYEGARTIAACVAIVRAAADGRPVRVEDPWDGK